MKLRTPKILIAAGWAGMVLAMRGAELPVEFTGVMTCGREVRVLLANRSTGTGTWLGIGEACAGYTVARLDLAADTVVLIREKEEHVLPLKSARVVHGVSAPPADIRRRILNNLRQLAAAADQFYLENGVIRATYDDLVGRTKYVKQMTSIYGEDYRAIEFAQGKPLQVTIGSGYTVSYTP